MTQLVLLDQEHEKKIYFLILYRRKVPPWWEVTGGRYVEQLQTRATQSSASDIQLQKHRLGKTSRRPSCWKTLGQQCWRGGWDQGRARKGRKQNRRLIRSDSCTQESEATPAFSLIKKILKSDTEHLWSERESKSEVQPRGHATKLALNSAPGKNGN